MPASSAAKRTKVFAQAFFKRLAAGGTRGEAADYARSAALAANLKKA